MTQAITHKRTKNLQVGHVFVYGNDKIQVETIRPTKSGEFMIITHVDGQKKLPSEMVVKVIISPLVL